MHHFNFISNSTTAQRFICKNVLQQQPNICTSSEDLLQEVARVRIALVGEIAFIFKRTIKNILFKILSMSGYPSFPTFCQNMNFVPKGQSVFGDYRPFRYRHKSGSTTQTGNKAQTAKAVNQKGVCLVNLAAAGTTFQFNAV